MTRDPDFEEFIETFGEATFSQEVPASALAGWKGRLPEQLLKYWQCEGWCAYRDGLFWTVDPAGYEELVEVWLEGTKLSTLDRFHVFARSAFGNLFLCGEKTGPVVTLDGVLHSFSAITPDLRPKNDEVLDDEIRDFFLGMTVEYTDVEDENGRPLFKRALKRLGPLAADEMYGFEPAVVLGGEMDLANLVKVKMIPHLQALRERQPVRPLFNERETEWLSKDR